MERIESRCGDPLMTGWTPRGPAHLFSAAPHFIASRVSVCHANVCWQTMR
jgi:hypothetical protein